MEQLRQSSPRSFWLRADTDPASVIPAVAGLPAQVSGDGNWRAAVVLQFKERLPGSLLDAVNDALGVYPDTALSATDEAGQDLTWTSRLGNVRRLHLALRDVDTLEPLRALQELRSLQIRSSVDADPSLDPLSDLPSLETLELEENARDFDAVARISGLRHLTLYASRTRTFDAFRNHPALETMRWSFGAVRDYTALATIPTLRGVQVYRTSRLLAEHLAPLAEMDGLEALMLDALPQIENLDALTGGPASTLRFLHLTGLRRLVTWKPLAALQALQELWTRESQPLDGDLSPLLNARELRSAMLWEHFDDDQIDRAKTGFRGDRLTILRSELIARGANPRGGRDVLDVLRVSRPGRVYVGPPE